MHESEEQQNTRKRKIEGKRGLMPLRARVASYNKDRDTFK